LRLYGLRPALRKAKLRSAGIGMHSLRHSFASALITKTGAVDRLAKAITGQVGHFLDTSSPKRAQSVNDEIAEVPLSVS
jgi:integrase